MAKGSGFEREISHALSHWWSYGTRDDIFWRTAGSGARATMRSKKQLKTMNQYGDLTTIDPTGQPFIDNNLIEIKRGYGGSKNIPKEKIETILHKMLNEGLDLKGTVKAIKNVFAKSRRTSGGIDPLSYIDSKQKSPLLRQWWEKAETEREEAGRPETMIIFQRDGRASCVMINTNYFEDLKTFHTEHFIHPTVNIKHNSCQLTITTFQDFFGWVEPDYYI